MFGDGLRGGWSEETGDAGDDDAWVEAEEWRVQGEGAEDSVLVGVVGVGKRVGLSCG